MEFCTCGAQLVEGALFCHRCGRNVRPLSNVAAAEAAPAETEAPAPAAPLPVTAAPGGVSGAMARAAAAAAGAAEISFHNRAAVGVAVSIAAISTVLGFLPVPAILAVFWKLVTLLSAGFVAVYVYHRRTGQSVSLRGGARMGWMTGMFSFVIALVMFAAGVAVLAAKGGLQALWKEQLSAYPASTAEMEEALRILESPAGMAMLVATIVMVLFLLFTLLPMIGGALGAKVLEKE